MEINELYTLLSKNGLSISTDTRTVKPGDTFVALKGDVFDANEFAAAALEAGATYVIIDNPAYKIDDRSILVSDTLKTLQDLARFHRKQFSIPILAIGGSNGKTTTKELVHRVLSENYKTHTTTGNLNNNIGVPLTLLRMNSDTEIAVIEIGANHPGEHLELLDILSPTHVLVTNNGADHLEGFGSLAGVRAANKEIYDWAQTHDAHALVNSAIPDLVQDSANLDRTLYPTKKYITTSSLYAGVQYDRIDFTTSLFGAYNEPNILAAIAVGEYFDVPLEQIREAIATYVPTLKRSQVIQKETYTLILDCYNANPSSMELALRDFCLNSSNGNRILLIGDMFELGTEEKAAHQSILSLIASLVHVEDIVICIGPRFFQNKHTYPFTFFATGLEAKNFYKKLDLNDTQVFVKGSRGMHLEDVIV